MNNFSLGCQGFFPVKVCALSFLGIHEMVRYCQVLVSLGVAEHLITKENFAID